MRKIPRGGPPSESRWFSLKTNVPLYLADWQSSMKSGTPTTTGCLDWRLSGGSAAALTAGLPIGAGSDIGASIGIRSLLRRLARRRGAVCSPRVMPCRESSPYRILPPSAHSPERRRYVALSGNGGPMISTGPAGLLCRSPEESLKGHKISVVYRSGRKWTVSSGDRAVADFLRERRESSRCPAGFGSSRLQVIQLLRAATSGHAVELFEEPSAFAPGTRR
jgi:hypothetical protein